MIAMLQQQTETLRIVGLLIGPYYIHSARTQFGKFNAHELHAYATIDMSTSPGYHEH